MNQMNQGRTVREERIRQRRRHLCTRAPSAHRQPHDAARAAAPPGLASPPALPLPVSVLCYESVLRTLAVQTFSSTVDTIRARTLGARTSPFGHVMKQTNTLLDGRSAGAAAAGAACAGARGDVRERGRSTATSGLCTLQRALQSTAGRRKGTALELGERGGVWGGSPP